MVPFTQEIGTLSLFSLFRISMGLTRSMFLSVPCRDFIIDVRLINIYLFCSDIEFQVPTSATKIKSPSRRAKSRWEPIIEEKVADRTANMSFGTPKYGAWNSKQVLMRSLSWHSFSVVLYFNAQNAGFVGLRIMQIHVWI